MQWNPITRQDDSTIEIPDRWLHIHYYEAFNLLFRIENALRLLVYIVLKREYQEKWSAVTIGSEEGDTTIAAVASKRQSQAGAFGYLGYPVTSPLMYLTTGELFRIITTDSYWKLFKPFFPGAKKVTEMKFDEISAVRNDLAHFRPIKADDVETVKQSSKHILTEVEQHLNDLISCPDTVPTNTEEDWYPPLKALGTSVCVLRFNQSTSEEWVRIDLTYKCPVLTHRNYTRFHSYSLLTIDGPSILGAQKTLSDLVIFCKEDIPGVRIGLDGNLSPQKILSFGFSRGILSERRDEIRSEIESIISKVTEETELIEQDNLARGDFVRATTTSIKILPNREHGLLNTTALESGYREDDPPEWWGELSIWVPDVISALHTYPWMPTAVSSYAFS